MNGLRQLTLSILGKVLADDILKQFSICPQKTEFDISFKLFLMKTVCMKCQILFSRENKKNITGSVSEHKGFCSGFAYVQPSSFIVRQSRIINSYRPAEMINSILRATLREKALQTCHGSNLTMRMS